jgi:DNA-binding phage protein
MAEVCCNLTMPKRTRPYREGLLEDLRNPELAAHYLSVALEDSDEMFVDSLRDVVEANERPVRSMKGSDAGDLKA